MNCPDCKGSGEYRGLETIEVCRTCNGKGESNVAQQDPVAVENNFSFGEIVTEYSGDFDPSDYPNKKLEHIDMRNLRIKADVLEAENKELRKKLNEKNN